MSQIKNKKQLRHHRKPKPWPYIVLGIGAALVLFGIASAITKPAAPKAAIEVKGDPSLKVDKEKVDLGDVKLGQTVTVSFDLMNVGDQTLRFAKAPYVEVREGC